ncbi:MAG: ribonuclease J [Bacilli bacterium]|mgnify:CR=1 FL=1|nr:ribonuclease J [Bacilli bacterium]MDD3304885.1 ribonuclease J [Bacilli bacterium]MDD4053515.1 ribonuclease J [Bacilli bacterium]MDD4411550.1 ribonuclease J [Bacilli bacterium]
MSKIKIFALGGLNENGKNMYVVEVNNDIFVFDAGLKYAPDKLFGIDYLIPDIRYLKTNIDRVKGIFLSHGHEENVGALPEILAELPDINIYGTKFTLGILKKMLEEDNIKANNLHEIIPHHKITFDKNSIFPIRLTHSIPDNVGYVLYTEDGAIFYTGNFVFDPAMMGAYKTDIGKLAYVGKQGVLCMLSESLYAEKTGFTAPSHRLSNLIKETLRKSDDRLIFNVMSANMYRVEELFREVMLTDRKVVVMGKRLQSMINNLIDMKYLNFDKNRIGSLNNINDKDAIILISSENEKPFTNLKRIVNGYDKYIKIKENDTVVFLEPVQDGMERVLATISDLIARTGADIITLSPKDYLLHHASSEDLMLMLDLIKPKYYMPVMADYRYMFANANIAQKMGVSEENILLKLNGEIVYFENSVLKDTGEKIAVEDVMIDGNSVGDIGELVLKDREMLSDNGIVIISTTIDRKTKNVLAGPEILTRGFIYVRDNANIINEIQTISSRIIKENSNSNYVEYNKIKNAVRDEVGKYLYKETGCKPMIITVILEV